MISIYVLCDSRKPGWFSYSGGYGFDYEPFYVGLTARKVSRRVREHFDSVDSLRGSRLRDSVQEEGFVVEVIWTGEDPKQAIVEEREAIRHIGREDLNLGPLLNVHSGGQHVSFKELSNGQRKRRLAEGFQKRYADMAGIRKGLRQYWDSLPSDARSERGFSIAQKRRDNGTEKLRGQAISNTKRKLSVATYISNLNGFDHFWVSRKEDALAYRSGQPMRHFCAFHGEVQVSRDTVIRKITLDREPCPFCLAEVGHRKDTKVKQEALARRQR